MNELHDAIAAGDEPKVTSLLANPACNVNQPHSESGEMPLAIALRGKNNTIITKLLRLDASFTAHLKGTRAVGKAKYLLEKTEKALNDFSEDSYLFNILRARVAYELAMMHKVSGHFDDCLSQLQQAIAFLGFISADKQDLYYFNKLFVLNTECFLVNYDRKRYPQAIPFFREAYESAQEIFKLEQNPLVLRPAQLTLARLFQRYGECQFKCFNMDASIDGHLAAFKTILSDHITLRDTEFFQIVNEIFNSMSQYASIDDADFYQFFASAFRKNEEEEEEGEVVEDNELIINEFTKLLGVLTSQAGIQHHRPHLIQTTINVMQLLLDSYTNQHFPSSAFKEYLSDDDNRRLFQAKLAQLKAFNPLRVLTASSPATMEAVVRRIGLLELENKVLKARVTELEKELPRPGPAAAPVLEPAQPAVDPTLFGGSLKRPRDSEPAITQDITPQDKEKKDEPPSKKPKK